VSRQSWLRLGRRWGLQGWGLQNETPAWGRGLGGLALSAAGLWGPAAAPGGKGKAKKQLMKGAVWVGLWFGVLFLFP